MKTFVCSAVSFIALTFTAPVPSSLPTNRKNPLDMRDLGYPNAALHQVSFAVSLGTSIFGSSQQFGS